MTDHSPNSPNHYEIAIESSQSFLTILSLLAVALTFTTSTCSSTLTRVYAILFIIVMFAITVISVFLSVAGAVSVYYGGKLWLSLIAIGWLLFAGLASVVGGFAISEFNSIMLASCKQCPEGFSGSFEKVDIATVCAQYLL